MEHEEGIAIHDGHLWMDINAAIASDKLNPIPGFTRNDLYRDSMRERDELIAKLMDLCGDMRAWITLVPPSVMDDIDGRINDLGVEVDW